MQGFISSVGNIESGGQGGASDTFVKLIVDLTGITPTTETVNSKQYNKFTFTKTDLAINTVSPLGDEESVAVDDALIYKLFPISNNNDDKGVYISYDGNTFSGYVLAQESTLTTVTFMFSYYVILSETSVVWQNYVDMVGSSGSSGSLYYNQMELSGHSSGTSTSVIVHIAFYCPLQINSLSDLRTFLSSCPTVINSGNKGIFLTSACVSNNASQTLFIHTIEINGSGKIFLYSYNASGGNGATLEIDASATYGRFKTIKMI